MSAVSFCVEFADCLYVFSLRLGLVAGSSSKTAMLGEGVGAASLERFGLLFLLLFNFHVAVIALIYGLSAGSPGTCTRGISFGVFREDQFLRQVSIFKYGV